MNKDWTIIEGVFPPPYSHLPVGLYLGFRGKPVVELETNGGFKEVALSPEEDKTDYGIGLEERDGMFYVKKLKRSDVYLNSEDK